MPSSVSLTNVMRRPVKMIVNHVKAKLKKGLPSVGTWLSAPSPWLVERIANAGFDWLVCDSEHNPMSIDILSDMFMAMNGTGTAPMVRIPWNSGENFKRVLDAGAWGVVVPMVNSGAEAEAAVGWAKYPPLGQRSCGGGRHRLSFGTGSNPDYTIWENDQTMVVLQIEHIKGVENADAILSVPGVDACYIGPNDLLASMGKRPQQESNDPEFVQALDHVVKTCQKYGVAPGLHTYSVEMINRRIAQGFQFVALWSEIDLMLSRMKGDLSQITFKRG
jgi:4-hydroxy-2-oxoheptanedioate aldolase